MNKRVLFLHGQAMPSILYILYSFTHPMQFPQNGIKACKRKGVRGSLHKGTVGSFPKGWPPKGILPLLTFVIYRHANFSFKVALERKPTDLVWDEVGPHYLSAQHVIPRPQLLARNIFPWGPSGKHVGPRNRLRLRPAAPRMLCPKPREQASFWGRWPLPGGGPFRALWVRPKAAKFWKFLWFFDPYFGSPAPLTSLGWVPAGSPRVPKRSLHANRGTFCWHLHTNHCVCNRQPHNQLKNTPMPFMLFSRFSFLKFKVPLSNRTLFLRKLAKPLQI